VVLAKFPLLSIATMNRNAGFDLSTGLDGVGVGSGVGAGTDGAVDFGARRPDCPNAPRKHRLMSTAHKPVLVMLEEWNVFRMLIREETVAWRAF
jgi:hypothetical protein